MSDGVEILLDTDDLMIYREVDDHGQTGVIAACFLPACMQRFLHAATAGDAAQYKFVGKLKTGGQ